MKALEKIWPNSTNLWLQKCSNNNLIIAGNEHSSLTEDHFCHERMGTLLRAAFVFSMAAVDKILHEAILYNFSDLLRSKEIDDLVNIPLSDSYNIAIQARERRGKGGKIRSRPGHKFKEKVLIELYKKSFLSNHSLEKVCACLGKKRIFTAYSKSIGTKAKADAIRDKWIRAYERRNSIAHECDIVRKKKARKVHFNPIDEKRMPEEIKFIGDFGKFLSKELKYA
jgi:hypothetical protein